MCIDGLNTISEITDQHGDVIEQYRYDAFGNIFTGITAPYNTKTYTGHEYDDKSGLINMNARWYNPTIGRFMTEDTYQGNLTNPLSQNRYAYVQNNPINMWDPSGNVPSWVGDGYHSESGSDSNSSWFKEWTLFSHDISYSSQRLVSETMSDDLRSYYQTLTQSKYETWTYIHEWNKTIYKQQEDGSWITIDEQWGSSVKTYRDTTVFTWIKKVPAIDRAEENRKRMADEAGTPPPNAVALYSVGSLDGTNISFKALTSEVSYNSLNDVQQEILLDALVKNEIIAEEIPYYLKKEIDKRELTLGRPLPMFEEDESEESCSNSNFVRPIREGYISSPYGERWGALHQGVDIAVPQGTPVYAITDGKMKLKINDGGPTIGFGYYIELTFNEEDKAIYGHLNGELPKEILEKFEEEHGKLEEGKSPFKQYQNESIPVNKDEMIGLTGYSGHTVPEGPGGAHLHFNLNLDGAEDGAVFYLWDETTSDYELDWNYAITDSVDPLSRINFNLPYKDGTISKCTDSKNFYEVYNSTPSQTDKVIKKLIE